MFSDAQMYNMVKTKLHNLSSMILQFAWERRKPSMVLAVGCACTNRACGIQLKARPLTYDCYPLIIDTNKSVLQDLCQVSYHHCCSFFS